jgi:hypothetical protein
VNTPPTFPKPKYYEVFNLIGNLSQDVKANICSLLLRVWRHTSSDQNHENCGTAWMSHDQMAMELHVSIRTTQDLFDESWERSFISREHFFKKDGRRIISTAPYTKATSHGMGEYLGSRYWVNWDAVRKAQEPKPETVTHQSQLPLENGVVKTTIPNPNGVAETATPIRPIGVAKIATPVAKTATKGSKQLAFTPLAAPASPNTGSAVPAGSSPADTAACADTAAASCTPLFLPASSSAEGSNNNNTHVDPVAGDAVGESKPRGQKGRVPKHSESSRPYSEAEANAEEAVRELELRRAERKMKMSANEVFRLFKNAFMQLVQQEKARNEYQYTERIKINGRWVSNPEFNQAQYDAMPKGIDLKLNVTWKHKTAAADLYNASKNKAKIIDDWKTFLVDGYEDDQFEVPVKHAGTEQRYYLLEHFLSNYVGSENEVR